ncbi:MAG: pantetheine-phosphate adenylyltransferase [Actinomycetota bacterium]|jgi:pantetheine-phosphate adenylyltransferase|nr:pantetheine-phosphate adenylyltransferase [Actinomycetota bacterium]
MALALCPGSYDPPTNGHVDVIERTAKHFDGVVAAVIANPSKRPEFSVEERSEMLASALGHVSNLQIAAFDGLLVDFARSRGVTIVVKGLRAVSDFEYELQMAQMNAALEPGLDTMFVTAKPEWAFLSSSLVKEVARFGGDVGGLVPAPVARALAERYGGS